VIDDKGYIKVVDRLRDVVKSGGEWISSTMLEDLLTSHPAVSEAAVISAKEEKWGERPVAIVSLKPGASQNEQDLKNHLDKFVGEGRIVKFWLPDRIVISHNPLPKASTGKIDKKTLRESYSEILTDTRRLC
jgi:fatty-acyl-CoA synthase